MTQEVALQILKTGRNALVTGEPGAGKTHVINRYIAWLEAAKVPVAVTASTGIAATHIGGVTIHSWSGIGARSTLTDADVEAVAEREKVVRRLRKPAVLIIDEVSMLDGRTLDAVDAVLRRARGTQTPFGGMQVIFVGDFFQLPPIAERGTQAMFAFSSRAFAEAAPTVCYLTEQFRQDDEQLLGLLHAIRKNEIEEEHYTLLGEQQDIAFSDIVPTRLYTHNADVDAVNTQALEALPGQAHTFSMSHRGDRYVVEGLVRSCLSPATLVLKEEAMVMCTKNNFDAGYVNGTLGRVVGFAPEEAGAPIIRTAAGHTITVTPQSWSVVEEGKVRGEIEQVPLRLAAAITVHKSQGMSLDAAEVDLTRTFLPGQGYVALSRVRTLQGLKVRGLGPNALLVDPQVVAQDQAFRAQSDSAAEMFASFAPADIAAEQERFVRAVGGAVPSDEAASGAAPAGARAPRAVRGRDTYAETLALLRAGRSVPEIARERGIATATVWSHLETLADRDQLSAELLAPLSKVVAAAPAAVLAEGFRACGDEKLKPIYEYFKEQYEYETLRAARLLYRYNLLCDGS